jgi:predicted nucleic acid-binding protein
MAGKAPGKRFALDTNIIYDLAQGKNFALTFLEVFSQKGYEFLLPPTVLQELAYAFKYLPEHRSLVAKGLSGLRSWGIKEFDLIAVRHGITQHFSLLLQTKGLLPPGENNDGFILAETALAEINVLVTCDRHLLDMDEGELKQLFNSQDLPSVTVCHPKDLLKAVNVRPKGK